MCIVHHIVCVIDACVSFLVSECITTMKVTVSVNALSLPTMSSSVPLVCNFLAVCAIIKGLLP